MQREGRGSGGAWSQQAGSHVALSVGRKDVADHKVHDLTPDDVSKGIAEGRYLLVDVREPNEVAVEAYPDAVVVPLSGFDPGHIPDPHGKQVVFACRSGKRSVTASLAAQAGGLEKPPVSGPRRLIFGAPEATLAPPENWIVPTTMRSG